MPRLDARTVFAMPMGPPHGGMTVYAAMLRRSALFAGDRAVLFDTTPPPGDRRILQRVARAAGRFFALAALVRRSGAEVVYFMTSSYAGFYEKGLLALACRAAGARTVLHPVGGFAEFHRAARLGRPLIRFLLRRASMVFAVEPRVAALIGRIAPRTPVVLVPNPVDCALFGDTPASPPEGPLRILFSGAIVETKGVFDLLDATALARRDLPPFRLVLIGDGPRLGECRVRAATLGLDDIVELRGWVSEGEKVALLRTSHVFCLPSHVEGTPLSVLEAMAAGLPVVATTVGGLPMVITSGHEGVLVPPRDPRALADALCAVLADPERRRRMGAAAFERVRERYDLPIVAGAFARQFNALGTGGPASVND